MDSLNGTCNPPHLDTPPTLALLIFKATTTGIILILNLFANSLSLVVIRKIRELDPVTKVFMTSMTVSDLGGGLGYILPVFASTVANRSLFGDEFCAILGFLNILFCFTSVLSLLSVNFERFLAVTRPFKYPTLMTLKRARLISIASWLWAVMTTAFDCFGPNRCLYYSNVMHACTTGPTTLGPDIEGTIFLLLFGTLPFGITLALFLRLFLLARFHSSKIAAQERAMGKLRSDRKAFNTFFIMTVCLAVGWTPLMIVFVYENLTRMSVSAWSMCFAQLMAFANTVINVMVYYFRNRAFKETAKRVCSRFRFFGAKFNETEVLSISSSF